jgi:hypothetical protein
MHAFVVHGKNPDPSDQTPYKAYVVAANDEDQARALVPGGYRIDHIERASPIDGAVLPSVLALIQISVAPYRR